MVELLERSRYRRILRDSSVIAGLLWLLGGSGARATATTVATGTPLAQLPNAAQELTAYNGSWVSHL